MVKRNNFLLSCNGILFLYLTTFDMDFMHKELKLFWLISVEMSQPGILDSFNPSEKKQHFFRTARGTFLACLVTSYAVVPEKKIKNDSANQRSEQPKILHISMSPRGTFMLNLVTEHAVVLQKLKM